ncbi:hypothetical protein MMOR_00180 [Mycolicibacterium moriokaense]|uniref:sulfate adenylyltransferase n=1 Tax=Mycolicibacterium moriokaense TaxID=39691 RepID=A0AAD1H5U8_9MYCO|nr:hypothetical protein MMOR_00180 [Mycolicibacterium moriokaense]
MRYRTVGDLTITGAVRSRATDIAGVIAEISAATVSERGETRADDRTSAAARRTASARATSDGARDATGDRMTRQLLRITTAGSVDDGKSTLIGRLLHDTDSLPLDHLEAVTDEEGVADLAALSDGLRAEREQGITIDVAYRFFSTDARSYILADTPGHERYTRNMFTGASNAHAAILLVDARAGVLRQTNRHARIAKLLGIKHFVAAVNKIDLVNFDEGRFDEVVGQIRQIAARLGEIDITVIPIAAKHGDNVVHRSERTPWYDGPTLLEYLEGIELSAPQPEPEKLRLPVQWVTAHPEQRRRYTAGSPPVR